ncbi:hypothetical protein ACFXPA_05630 [Amycolatopsis sp. NPDC059090]|uniref:hypothetical protein n=1 Tax=unclassified Amycolatopsis TaxID=2618356 RepID=UPI00366C232F
MYCFERQRLLGQTAGGRSGSSLCVLKGHAELVREVPIIPDGNEIVSVGDDNTIRFWQSYEEEPTCDFYEPYPKQSSCGTPMAAFATL